MHYFAHTLSLFAIALAFCPAAHASDPSYMSEPDYGFDRQGKDYRDFIPATSDPTLCAEACAAEIQCAAWTYNKPHSVKGASPHCWLKIAVPAKQAVSHAVSGTKGLYNK